jgi:DNA invertase Pin-like site-specific DNA recombinase
MPTKDLVNRTPVGLPADHPLSTAPRVALVPRRALTARSRDVSGLIAWLYGRVSDELGGRSSSVTQQNELSRDACDEHGLNLTREYNTTGTRDGSASHRATKRRVWWEQLCADILAAQADPSLEMPDVIVIYEVSRAERRSESWNAFLRLIAEPLGVRILVVSEYRVYDVSIDADWKALATAGVDAEAEVRRTRSRVTRNLPKRLSTGVPFGRVPVGWVVKRDGAGSRVTEIGGRPVMEMKRREVVIIDNVPVPADEAPGKRLCQFRDDEIAWLHQEITRRVGDRDPFSVIRDDLTRRGVLTPNDWLKHRRGQKITNPAPWTTTMVVRIAGNLRNVGKVERDGEIIDGQWEAIVDQADFDRAQLVLKDICRVPDDHRAKSVPGLEVHLLRPRCGCGAEKRMRGLSAPRNPDGQKKRASGRKKRYECKAGKGCARQIDAEALETYVALEIGEFLAQPGIYASRPVDDRALLNARADRDRAQLELDALYDKVKNGKCTARMAEAEEVRLLGVIDAAEKRITTYTVPTEIRTILGMSDDASSVTRWLTDDTVPVAARRAAIDRLVSITVNPAVPGATATLDAIEARVVVTPLCTNGCGNALHETPQGWRCSACAATLTAVPAA